MASFNVRWLRTMIVSGGKAQGLEIGSKTSLVANITVEFVPGFVLIANRAAPGGPELGGGLGYKVDAFPADMVKGLEFQL